MELLAPSQIRQLRRLMSVATDPSVLYQQGVQHMEAKRLKEAIACFAPCAEQNHADALFRLGCLYRDGQGTSKDEAKAAKLFRNGMDLGNLDSQCAYGQALQNGAGVGKDVKTAVSLFQRGMEQGHANSVFRLGVCTETGEGVDKNQKAAVELYLKAGELGSAGAQYNLGLW